MTDNTTKDTCGACREGVAPPFDFSMAFQPIVDVAASDIYAHEALVRGVNGEGEGSVLSRVTPENRYAFDQSCRVKAIEMASALGIAPLLRINFLPNAVYRPEVCIRTTLETAGRCGLPIERIIFEVTEGEHVEDHAHLAGIIAEYRRMGMKTAIDDFGAGHSGLNLLAEFQPDLIKLDMALTRNIDSDRVRRSIVTGILSVCRDLDLAVIAEGIETQAELRTLKDMGVSLFQGYLFAKPAFRQLVKPQEIAFS